jgi:antitoxin (DNA-binding transcriptional repressor) of toxin-antitoxin stability system
MVPMNAALEDLLRRSLPEASLRSARKHLDEFVAHVGRDRTRILLTDRGYPIACLVPIADAVLLTELERRFDRDAGLDAMQAWERAGKQTSPVASLLARFKIKRRQSTATPVVIASTADTDLIAVSVDHRTMAQAISRLNRHPAVTYARRHGGIGDIRGIGIEGYRVIFLIEEARIVVLRIGAGDTLDLLL